MVKNVNMNVAQKVYSEEQNGVIGTMYQNNGITAHVMVKSVKRNAEHMRYIMEENGATLSVDHQSGIFVCLVSIFIINQ